MSFRNFGGISCIKNLNSDLFIAMQCMTFFPHKSVTRYSKDHVLYEIICM